MNWTIERVKDELPDIKVYVVHERAEYLAVLRGRRKKFARAFLLSAHGRVTDTCYHYSWKQISDALNNDRPLIA
jgi:hypothetical protein